jgi:hypothetical protein
MGLIDFNEWKQTEAQIRYSALQMAQEHFPKKKRKMCNYFNFNIEDGYPISIDSFEEEKNVLQVLQALHSELMGVVDFRFTEATSISLILGRIKMCLVGAPARNLEILLRYLKFHSIRVEFPAK